MPKLLIPLDDTYSSLICKTENVPQCRRCVIQSEGGGGGGEGERGGCDMGREEGGGGEGGSWGSSVPLEVGLLGRVGRGDGGGGGGGRVGGVGATQ